VAAATLLVFVACVALGVGLVPRLSAFTGPDVREGLVSTERPLALDPLAATDPTAAGDVGHLLYRSLLRLDAQAYPQPDLASGYAVDQSGLVYTVRLAHGPRWSDGSAITVADVVATFSFAQSRRATDRALAGVLSGIDVQASGDSIVFTLPSPRVSFIAELTQLPILPLGRLGVAQLAALTAHPSQAMVASGPFQVLSSDSQTVELSPNPYTAVRPAITRLELRLYPAFDAAAGAFRRGEVDAVLATTPGQRAQLMAQPQAVAHDITTFRFVDLLFNERTPGLDDPSVRHAIATALDRRALITSALSDAGGMVQTDPFSRGWAWIARKDAKEQASADSARAALDAAGWTVATNGVRQRADVTLRFLLTAPDIDPLPRVANRLAQQLTNIGIAVDVQAVPAATMFNLTLVPRAFQLALTDWDAGADPDVSAFWRSNAEPPTGFYVSGGEADPFLDQALDMLATLGPKAGRIAAAQSVAQHLTDDAPAVFLYTPTVSYVMRGPLAAAGIPRVGGSAARYDQVVSWRPM